MVTGPLKMARRTAANLYWTGDDPNPTAWQRPSLALHNPITNAQVYHHPSPAHTTFLFLLSLKPSRNISQRCHLAWDSLPNWLRYSPKCWEQNLHIAVSLMMIISYLAYLYNDFLIQRLIAGKNNPRGNRALLTVSADILSTVLTLGMQREQMVDLRPDFAWTVRIVNEI